MTEAARHTPAGAFVALLLIDILIVSGGVAVGFMTGNWMMTGVIIAGGAVLLAAVFIMLQAARKGADDNAAG